MKQQNDEVNHPKHYTSHPSGIECIQVTEHFNFNMGNAIKYLWRTDEKGDPIVQLRKAGFYIQREIARRLKLQVQDVPGVVIKVWGAGGGGKGRKTKASGGSGGK